MNAGYKLSFNLYKLHLDTSEILINFINDILFFHYMII